MAERNFLDAVEDGPKGDVRIMLLSLGASRNVLVLKDSFVLLLLGSYEKFNALVTPTGIPG